MKKQLRWLLCIAAGMLTSCLDDDYVDQSEVDQEKIRAYIAEKDLQLEYDQNSGIHFRIYERGNEDVHPTEDSSFVTVNYEGRLLSDEVFSAGDSVEMDLERQPIGFQLGVSSIGEGGDIFMILPSQVAYGTAAFTTDTPYSVSVPPNSVLIYRVKLLKVDTDQP